MSTETFRAVEPLRMGGITFAKYDGDDLVVIPDYSALTVDEARALYEWLGRALPCGHQYSLQLDRGERCIKCGATLP